MEGYHTGRFPDGFVIVFDLLEVKAGGNAIAEGPRKILGVMQRDGSEFAETGGWGSRASRRATPTGAPSATRLTHLCHPSRQFIVISMCYD